MEGKGGVEGEQKRNGGERRGRRGTEEEWRGKEG